MLRKWRNHFPSRSPFFSSYLSPSLSSLSFFGLFVSEHEYNRPSSFGVMFWNGGPARFPSARATTSKWQAQRTDNLFADGKRDPQHCVWTLFLSFFFFFLLFFFRWEEPIVWTSFNAYNLRLRLRAGQRQKNNDGTELTRTKIKLGFWWIPFFSPFCVTISGSELVTFVWRHLFLSTLAFFFWRAKVKKETAFDGGDAFSCWQRPSVHEWNMIGH